VTATYAARDLRGGFAVVYGDAAGTEWELLVSDRQAVNDLFLAIEDTPPVRRVRLAPPQLTITIERFADDAWRLTNTNPDYTWEECVIEVGSSRMTLPQLDPRAAVVVRAADLTPPVTGGAMQAPAWVTCTVADMQFTAVEKR
jgi:hypothetical protein